MTKEPKELKYKLKNGDIVPLFEADQDMAFEVRRSDRRGAVIGDPTKCIEALALCRMYRAEEAYIGSSKDAVVVFKGTATRPFRHALHFIIRAKAARVRDAFDTNKSIKKVTLWLGAPTEGRTMKHRRILNNKRKKEIKAGAPVAKRSVVPRKQRVTRLGVARRPTAQIIDNVVSLEGQQQAA